MYACATLMRCYLRAMYLHDTHWRIRYGADLPDLMYDTAAREKMMS